MKIDLNTLPNCEDYRHLLSKAVVKFNISFNKARDNYGRLTYKEWEELLN